MVKYFFGLPGAGKTTIMSKIAKEAVKSKRYKNVYGNVKLRIPGYTYIDNDCIGRYELVDGIVLIDEATLFADSRDYKKFGKERTEFFMLHRHDNIDVVLFSQAWDAVDKKIRQITDMVYYVFKPRFLGFLFTNYYRIPYDIIIPDPKKNQQSLGEIIQGYCKPSFFQRLFNTKRVFRPFYYKYFDSWARTPRPELPECYSAYCVKDKSGVTFIPVFLKKKVNDLFCFYERRKIRAIDKHKTVKKVE